MKFTNLILSSKTLLLALILTPISLFSQFSDGFESGTYMPTWADGAGAFTRTVTTTAPAVGTYCFEITGGTNGHYDGIIGNFPAVQATEVSWRVKGTGTAHGGYIVIGDASTPTNNGIAFVRITDLATLRFYDGATNFDYPITPNTWYNVEMRDIDWTNKHFDIWIDGVLQVTDFAFRSNASTSVSQIHFYNFHNTTAYLDEVIVSALPPCAIAPTAVCQDATVYLDAAGNGSIVGSDLDGGSIDNCGTSGLTFTASQTAFTCADVTSGGAPSDALIITGAYDGPLVGGTPKGIELYVASNIADLSLYGLGSANNGGGTDGEEFTFPAVSATAGQFLYVATDSVEFNNWFGFFPNYTTSSMLINGDDAVELFYNAGVVDVFGDINVDGTGQAWEYLDGWAYRNSSTGPDGSTFNIANWSFSGINVLDGETSNGTAATPFPAGSYTAAGGGTSVTLTVTDGNLNSANCVANVTVLDTISPTASQPTLVMVQCIGDVPPVDPSIFTDAADNCAAPTVLFVSEISDGGSCPEILTRTYSITDASGNSINVDHVIMINDDIAPTASSLAPLDVECIADVPAADILDVVGEADNCTVAPIVTWVGDVSDGATCPETITRTYSIADDCGNAITVDQIITVNDITGPLADNTLNTINSNCDVTPTAPTATDNCSGSITGAPDVSFPITAVGTTSIVWTYTDVCGNSSTQTQDVIISAMDLTTTVNGLTITASNAGADTYQWIDCNTNSEIVGATSQDYTTAVNGSFAVIMTVNGCEDTTACVIIDNVGLNDMTIETLVLFPNPSADGVFTIDYEGTIQGVQIIDMLGRVVEIPVDLNTGLVDGTTLAPGKYMVEVTIENDKTIIQQVVISE